jgi:predicted metalloprotease
MKWEGHEQSRNVEDRRGQGGGRGMPRLGGGRGIGLGTIVIALLASFIFGINPLTVLGVLGGGEMEAPMTQTAPAPQSTGPVSAQQDPGLAFVSTVLRDTELVWGQVFQTSGGRYQEPTLAVFRGATRTACGMGESAMGPFYCPGDRNVYLDLNFFDTLQRQLQSPGDFARAYVIAHEVAHHVQNLMGITDKVDSMRGRVSETQMNALSVRLELQADCLAGVWAHHSQRGKGWLEQGDIDEALNAAAQIGDDNLQRRSQGMVVPESFTHGSSAQRRNWFGRGLQAGSLQACDTFNASSL